MNRLLLSAGFALLSTVVFGQQRYYKDKKGNVITEAEYNKVVSDLIAMAVDSKRQNEKLVMKNDLALVRETKDSLIFDYSLEFSVDLSRAEKTKKKN